MKSLSVIVILVFGFLSKSFSQSESNLKVIQNLIDSSSVLILNKLNKANKISVEINTPENLVYLRNSILKSFSEKVKLSDSADIQLKINLDNVDIKYSKLEKDGFWGNHRAERNISISGNYIIYNNSESLAADDFELSSISNCLIEELSNLENTSLNFTKGKIPEEPFFSGLYEPLIAVSAIAVTIYLFFSVRSK